MGSTKHLRVTMLLAPALLLSFSGYVSPASAKGDKVDVCHLRGDGSYKSINVSASAVPAHLSHGDGFTGQWPNVTLGSDGFDVYGTWDDGTRPDFFGEVINGSGGCSVLMVFPDDASYQGTLLDGCSIQWSFRNTPGTTDPDNVWTRADCRRS